MRLCQLFSKRSTPFLLAPALGAPVAVATWLVTQSAGFAPAMAQLATVGAFLLFSAGVTVYVARCLNRYARG